MINKKTKSKMIKATISIIIVTMIVCIGISNKTKIKIEAEENKQIESSKEIKNKKEENKKEPIIYKSNLAIEIEDKYINKIYDNIKNEYKYVTKDKIRYAFNSARNRMPEEQCLMSEYYTKVALILATMEAESGFQKINSKTQDYGLMQINEIAIPTLINNLGDDVIYLKTNDAHNVEAGSYIIDICYNKAKEKHSDNIIWWTYAYYNRGLYFENEPWDYNQTNKRSSSLIKRYNKYHEMLI